MVLSRVYGVDMVGVKYVLEVIFNNESSVQFYPTKVNQTIINYSIKYMFAYNI